MTPLRFNAKPFYTGPMKPFTHLTGTAAPLPIANVDTDMIIPKQFLKTVSREGWPRACSMS